MKNAILFLMMAISANQSAAQQPAPAEVRLATFSCPVTPPMGSPLCGGWIKPVEGVDNPELVKGIVLRDSGGTYVLCSADWCELRNDAHDLFRAKIAEAAETIPSRVAVQCVHQHNAPMTDSGAQKILDKIKDAPLHADLKFLDESASKVAAAVRSATHWSAVTDIGAGMAKVEGVASSRRVLQPDGTVKVRYSSTTDPELQAAPEGKIDPWLRTVAFFQGEKPLAYLHYYATHPMSYYGDGRPTWDFPGIARERLEQERLVCQIYFTGCAGDITAGKYNDGSKERRPILADRIYDGMKQSIASLVRQPATKINWQVEPVYFSLRRDESFSKKVLTKSLENPAGSATERLNAAINLSWISRVESGRPIEITCLSMGSLRILHLPGEPFIEYQLTTQAARPDLFVAVAGYGDGGPGYICTAEAFGQGGYEPTVSLIAPESEGLLKGAIAKLLGAM